MSVVSASPASLRDKRVLVIGATGFLGAALTERLHQLGASVTATSRSISPRKAERLWARPVDAGDPAQLARVFDEVDPEVVYHLTSDSRGGQDMALIPGSIQNDILPSLNILHEVARRGEIRLVMTGSLEEPQGAADEATPISPYAAAKWVSAGYARMFALLEDVEVVLLRLMMTYGPGQKPYKVIPSTILSLLQGRPALLGQGLRQIDWVFLDDVTEAFIRAAIAPYPGARSIEIGTGRTTSLRSCLEIIGEQIGRPDLLKFGALPDRRQEMERAANVERAAAALSWRSSVNLADGLAATIAGYRREASSPS